MNYTAQDFMKVVEAENMGQITSFKSLLKKYGHINRNRAPFTDVEVKIFNEMREAKYENNLSWEQAAEQILGGNEIVESIKSVEIALQILQLKLNSTNDIEVEQYYDAQPKGMSTVDELIEEFSSWKAKLKKVH